MIISAAIASVVIVGVATGAAALNSQPVPQHVQFEVIPRAP
jgi:hypothetical protein